MPSAFDAEFLSVAVPELLSTFGQTAAYTRHDGIPRTITVAVTKLGTQRDESQGYATNRRMLETFCKLDPSTGVDSPREHDQLVIDGEVWRFSRIIDQDGNSITIEWASSNDIRPKR